MFKPTEPHGTVQGDGVAGAKFYQDGHYYDPHHRYLFSNPNTAPPPGEKLRSMEQAQAAYEARQNVAQPAVAMGQPAAVSEPESSAPSPIMDTALSREQQLHQHPVPKLQQLQLAILQAMNEKKPPEEQVEPTLLKKQVIGGQGAKAKLIAWLLANTTE